MWGSRIAVQLRRRGFDVIAATEPKYADRFRNTDDELVFARAQDDARAIVTEQRSNRAHWLRPPAAS
jgi:hypothetical protein